MNVKTNDLCQTTQFHMRKAPEKHSHYTVSNQNKHRRSDLVNNTFNTRLARKIILKFIELKGNTQQRR